MKCNYIRLILTPALVEKGIVDRRLARIEMNPPSTNAERLIRSIAGIVGPATAKPNLDPYVIGPIHYPSDPVIAEGAQHAV
jgi:hypothetical protein